MTKTTFRIKVAVEGKTVHRTVVQWQYPMTGAYAFTDYRSQGQTIPYVLVDIATPAFGSLDLFNLYVALSRSSGRGTIRLLRDFNEEIFKQRHSAELLQEDDRLEWLNEQTKEQRARVQNRVR
jgi:ATP-dependent exoDNAse (exonuclease V) alpha subunit